MFVTESNKNIHYSQMLNTLRAYNQNGAMQCVNHQKLFGKSINQKNKHLFDIKFPQSNRSIERVLIHFRPNQIDELLLSIVI